LEILAVNIVKGLDKTHFEFIDMPQSEFAQSEHANCDIAWNKGFEPISSAEIAKPQHIEESPKAVSVIVPDNNGAAISMPAKPTIDSDSQAVKTIMAQLSQVALEREDAIRALFLSLIARQHLVFYGEGGTGKSWLVKHFSDMLDMSYFYYQIYQATTEAHLFGSIDYKRMHDTGEMRHVSFNSLLEARIAFLDEIGNSSSVIRNLLKSPMEERIFKDGYDVIQMPLDTIVGASNSIIEYKKDATEAAFADRWLSRVHIQRLQRPENRKKLVNLRFTENNWPKLDVSVIDRLQSYLSQVEISPAIIDAADAMRVEILSDPAAGNLDMSDRRFEHTMLLVRANAILHGRLRAKRNDLIVFGLTAWNNHEEGEDSKLAEWLKAKLVSQLDKIEAIDSAVDEAYAAWEANISGGEVDYDPAEKMAAGSVTQKVIARQLETLKRLRPNLEDEDETDAANKLETKIASYNKSLIYGIAEIAANSQDGDDMDSAIANLKK
jgi:MoxR-like ATPase